MPLAFKIISLALAALAAYFFWYGNTDGVYVSAVLAAVAFFLSIRFEVKGRNRQRELEREAAGQSDTAPEEPASGS